MPESLGNASTLLERGVVCDRCNNGPLASCDEALVNCPPIALLRTARFIRNKKNRLPRALFGSAGVYALNDEGEDANLYLRVPDEAALVDRGRSFDLQLVKPWSAKQWSRASRAMLKAGFEMLAHENGKAYVMDRRFDGVRKAVLRGGFQGWVIYSSVNGPPTSEITLHYPPMEITGTRRLGLAAAIVIFGLRLATAWPGRQDVLRTELPDEPELRDLRVIHFDRTPSATRDDITMTLNVTYGGRDEWGNDMPFASEIAKIDAA